MAGGEYGTQVIAPRSSARNLSPGCAPGSTTQCIVFRPAAGAVVSIAGNLEIHGSSIWIQGTATPSGGIPTRARSYNIKVSGYVDTEADSNSTYPDHVIVQGIDSTSIGMFSVKDATFRDLDVGPATVGANCRIVEGSGIENKVGNSGDLNVVPTNIVLDRVIIHNQNRNADGEASDCHFGGLFLINADGLTIKNSVFSQNAVYDIQIQNFDGPPPKNVRIENNWFGCPVNWLYETSIGGEGACDRQADIQFAASARFADWLVRYNSFTAGFGAYNEGASFANFRVVGNAGSRPSSCYAGMTFAYNAWNGAGCSRTDKNVHTLPFVATAPGNEDLHLRPGTAARALVQPTTPDLRLPLDMEGKIRPLRFPRDAGALERDTAVLVLGRSIGSASIGMSRHELERAYGTPRRKRRVALGPKKTAAQVESFAVPGGTLDVTIVAERVVGLSTASSFYTTPQGFGVGSEVTAGVGLTEKTWAPCTRAFQRNVGSVSVSLRPNRAKRKIAVVTMLRRAYEQPCKGSSGGKS